MSSDMNGSARPYQGRILVEDKKILSATTSVTFYCLEAGIGDFYYFELVKDASIQCNWCITVNDNTVLSNYNSQYIFATSTSLSSARSARPDVIYSTNGNCSMSSGWATVTPNGTFSYTSYHGRHLAGTTPELQNYSGCSSFTIDRIRSITFVADTTNGIGAGSRLRLFRDF